MSDDKIRIGPDVVLVAFFKFDVLCRWEEIQCWANEKIMHWCWLSLYHLTCCKSTDLSRLGRLVQNLCLHVDRLYWPNGGKAFRWIDEIEGLPSWRVYHPVDPCFAQEIYRIMKENHQLLQNIETCQPVVRTRSICRPQWTWKGIEWNWAAPAAPWTEPTQRTQRTQWTQCPLVQAGAFRVRGPQIWWDGIESGSAMSVTPAALAFGEVRCDIAVWHQWEQHGPAEVINASHSMRMAGEYDDDIMRIRDEDHRKREVHGAHSAHSAVHIAWIMDHVRKSWHGTGWKSCWP